MALERKQKKKIIYRGFKKIDNTKIIKYQNSFMYGRQQYTGSTNETQIRRPIYDYINITEQTAHREVNPENF